MMALRDKLGWGLAMAVSLALIASLAGVVWGGPLDPTAPPGSTGKNVITSLPFTISQPGSYVLNGNLTGVSGQNGISVNAENVTIDLQGFELVGVAGAVSGINGTQHGLTVLNGTIRNWPSYGLTTGSLKIGGVADRLNLISNGAGIFFGPRAAVSNCRVENSTSANAGIQAGIQTTVSNCRVTLNAGVGISLGNESTVKETNARSNGGSEIVVGSNSSLENCAADGGGGAGTGIDVGTDSIVRGCTATNNGGVEIMTGAGSTVENCTADGAGTAGNGIQLGDGSSLSQCTASNNVADGILAGARATVLNCLAQNNQGAGIHVTGQRNRIESNQALYNYRGIQVDTTANVIVLNSAAGNVQPDLQLVNYQVAAGNEYVPAASVNGTTNPWSNIGY